MAEFPQNSVSIVDPTAQGMKLIKFVAHSHRVIEIAGKFGWRPGARYTNLRDIRRVSFEGYGFLDINWKRYDFIRHVDAAAQCKPFLTVARDIERLTDLDLILKEAHHLRRFAQHVVLVPKDEKLDGRFREFLPKDFILGFSVPTRYGGTKLATHNFDRPVHLLGGRPEQQRRLAEQMSVVSIDCNRFTLDAAFGDYFDGKAFRPHPIGGYERCLVDSIKNINACWNEYRSPHFFTT